MKKRKHALKCVAAVIGGVAALAFSIAAHGAPKGLLVLQAGSDWCESGEDVRKVFESGEFRAALAPRFEFAVYDDMDSPSAEVAEANRKLEKLRVKSLRFPAITCVTPEPRRFFAQLENIPFDVSPQELAGRIAAAAHSLDEAEKLFAGAKSATDEKASADFYGRAFALLAGLVGDNLEKKLFEGDLAWKEEWKALSRLDDADRFGWKMRFTAGTGIGFVEKATKFRKDGDFEGGAKFIASLRAIPSANLSVVQKQAIEIAEYALWRMDESKAAANKEILRRALALGRDTVWGQCALGYLLISGEDIKRRDHWRAALLPRPPEDAGPIPECPLDALEASLSGLGPCDAFDEDTKLRFAQYAVLRRAGKEAWDVLASRPGARKFLREFFADRAWLEDFAWSGTCDDWGKALCALESIVFQDGGRWVGSGDCTGRRFATALALMIPEASEAQLADVLDAYRTTALSKRLHKAALKQPVWLWRYAIRHMTSRPPSMPASFDYLPEIARQQRTIDAFVNAPMSEYAGTFRLVPWRNDNCLGEWVQRDKYYEPWVAAGEWVTRRYTPIVGGVCGELSNIGAACANAHGLPAMPVGQPHHCAYGRRLLDGRWEIDYNINFGTGFHSIMPFRDTHRWTYCQAHEATFGGDREKRMDADRFVELAHLAESMARPAEDVAAFYAAARAAWPVHYIAWRTEGEWIERSALPLPFHREFALASVSALKGWRQPLWDLLAPYFARVAKERGRDALAAELVHFAPLLRQGEDKLAEEGDFKAALAKWMKPLENDAALKEKVLFAILVAQAGTPDYFTQTLSGNPKFLLGEPKRFDRLLALLKGDGASSGIDLAALILEASRSGNLAAFRQLAAIQTRLHPVKQGGAPYPENDFDAKLLSCDGMVSSSTTSVWDKPARYPQALDSTPPAGNAVHTNKEKSPWVMVTLPGDAMVKGIVLENKCPGLQFRHRMVPLEIQISTDGDEWTTVYTDETLRETYKVDLRSAPVRGRLVRVRRRPEAKDDCFHITKLLVYGDRLY